jgi:hypothetical protein
MLNWDLVTFSNILLDYDQVNVLNVEKVTWSHLNIVGRNVRRTR